MLKNTQNSFHGSVTGGAVSYSRVSLQVGTSSVVYPAAMFAPQVAARGVPVAEFNMENTPATTHFKHVSFFALFLLVCGFPLQPFLSLHFCLRFHFQGPCGTTLPAALARHKSEPNWGRRCCTSNLMKSEKKKTKGFFYFYWYSVFKTTKLLVWQKKKRKVQSYILLDRRGQCSATAVQTF